MSDVVLVAVVAAVPVTITSITGLIVAVRALRLARSTHTLVNSKADKADADLTTALKRIETLQDLIVKLGNK